jgi:hypothetical protein
MQNFFDLPVDGIDDATGHVDAHDPKPHAATSIAYREVRSMGEEHLREAISV